MNKLKIISLLLVVLSIAISFWLYPQMPNVLPNHWGINGQADGYASKESALFCFPLLLLVIFILLNWLPKADPKQENIAFNQKYLDRVILAIMFFMFAINIGTSALYLGYSFNFGDLMLPLLGLLFVFIGKNIENIKPNWFFGIRTPWTINDEAIWVKTHKTGSKMFGGLGISLIIIWALSLFKFFSKEVVFLIFMGEMIAVIVWSFVYPYLLWKKGKK